MYCYTQSLTEEQEKILNCINNSSSNMNMQEQFNFLMAELNLTSQALANKLLHLGENKFIVNKTYFKNNDLKLGIELTADGITSIHSLEAIELTPSGLGYLKANDILKQILNKAIEETNLSQVDKITIFNKMWQEIKDTGIDFLVKLTKSCISGQ